MKSTLKLGGRLLLWALDGEGKPPAAAASAAGTPVRKKSRRERVLTSLPGLLDWQAGTEDGRQRSAYTSAYLRWEPIPKLKRPEVRQPKAKDVALHSKEIFEIRPTLVETGGKPKSLIDVDGVVKNRPPDAPR